MPQSDRHKNDPVSIRIEPPELRARLDAHLKRTGQSRNAFVVQAIQDRLAKEETADRQHA